MLFTLTEGTRVIVSSQNPEVVFQTLKSYDSGLNKKRVCKEWASPTTPTLFVYTTRFNKELKVRVQK